LKPTDSKQTTLKDHLNALLKTLDDKPNNGGTEPNNGGTKPNSGDTTNNGAGQRNSKAGKPNSGAGKAKKRTTPPVKKQGLREAIRNNKLKTAAAACTLVAGAAAAGFVINRKHKANKLTQRRKKYRNIALGGVAAVAAAGAAYAGYRKFSKTTNTPEEEDSHATRDEELEVPEEGQTNSGNEVSTPAQTKDTQTQQDPPKKNYTLYYVLGGIAAVAVLVGLTVFFLSGSEEEAAVPFGEDNV